MSAQKTIQDFGEPRNFSAGKVIYQADFFVAEPSVFLITDGRVEVVKRYTPLKKEIYEYGRGDLFGMLEVYTGTARLTDARAVTDVQTLAFSRANFEKAMTINLNFAVTAIRLMSRMLRQVNSRIKTLS